MENFQLTVQVSINKLYYLSNFIHFINAKNLSVALKRKVPPYSDSLNAPINWFIACGQPLNTKTLSATFFFAAINYDILELLPTFAPTKLQYIKSKRNSLSKQIYDWFPIFGWGDLTRRQKGKFISWRVALQLLDLGVA